MKTMIYLIFTLLLLTNCSKNEVNEYYTNKGFKPDTNILTPEILWKFGRLINYNVSPNLKQIVYSIAYTNIDENKSFTDIYIYNTTSKTNKQITFTKKNEHNVKWRPDGKKITYTTDTNGHIQLWEINPDGSSPKQVSDIKNGIIGYQYSPDLSKILFVSQIKLDSTISDIYPDLKLANARIEDDIMYRHWDRWSDGTYNHIIISNYNEGSICTKGVDIMKNEKFDSPLKPFEDMQEITWSPNSKLIAYTCKKQKGKTYALSTNSDIYIYDTDTKKTTNITKDMPGYDRNPLFSKDGNSLLFESMARNGYESDKNRLIILNLSTNKTTDLTENFNNTVKTKIWSNDNQIVYFISNNKGTDEIFFIDVNKKTIKQLTSGTHDFTTISTLDNKLIGTKMTMSHPTEICEINIQNGNDSIISDINKSLLDQIKMGKVESRWIKTTDNKEMLTWVIYPPNFNPQKKYPTLLYCQGGPQATVSQFWSYRWNFQLMAANNYIIIAPNRRGLPGFGLEWNEQISGDYGGQNMQDYLSAIDSMSKESFVDKDKIGAIGASYGGYSVYWLAGNHNKRFKAFVSHCGIFNFEQMYSTTEETFFVNWDLKGAYWDLENKEAQKSYTFSPHKFIQNWDTPILVIHGEKDFRIPYTQGMAAFNSAILRDIPARFLYFPEENHWVLSPQNGILWHREFFRWLNKWLK
ncbi:MAG: S9 family peptidase [Marinilabiliaceae bacterium]|nr:S9 family peptidase [Marinilabiliaceae bacterium]